MGRVAWVAVLAAILAVSAGDAAARTSFYVDFAPDAYDDVAPSALSGDGLAVLDVPLDGVGAPERLEIREPGGRASMLSGLRPLLELALDEDDVDSTLDYQVDTFIAASARRVAVSRSISGIAEDGYDAPEFASLSELWTARRDGRRARRLYRCRGVLALQPVAVDGDVVAFPGVTCARGRASLGVADLRPGSRPRVRRFLGAEGTRPYASVELAGRYVAGGTSNDPAATTPDASRSSTGDGASAHTKSSGRESLDMTSICVKTERSSWPTRSAVDGATRSPGSPQRSRGPTSCRSARAGTRP